MDNQNIANLNAHIAGQDNVVSTLVADIVAAYVSNNNIDPKEVPNLITEVFAALTKTEERLRTLTAIDGRRPAVDPNNSVFDDYIICLEDGRKFKSLKRHLMSHYGLTPEQYREKWGLDVDYPMVAPNYALERSSLAKKWASGAKHL